MKAEVGCTMKWVYGTILWWLLWRCVWRMTVENRSTRGRKICQSTTTSTKNYTEIYRDRTRSPAV